MRKQFLLLVIGVIVAALAPAAAVAGVDSGACIAILAEQLPESTPEGNGGNAFICADAFSSEECNFFCGDAASPEGSLFLVGCEWLQGLTCDDPGVIGKIGEPWEGACSDLKGALCVLISEELPNWTSEEICTQGNGAWEPGGMCGAPVPTLPRAGQAALMVILMLGALVILNLSGTLRSA